MLDKSLKLQKPNQPVVEIVPFIFQGDKKVRQNEVLHMKKTESKINIFIEGISLTKKAKKYSLSNRAAHLRSRAMALAESRAEMIPKGYRFK